MQNYPLRDVEAEKLKTLSEQLTEAATGSTTRGTIRQYLEPFFKDKTLIYSGASSKIKRPMMPFEVRAPLDMEAEGDPDIVMKDFHKTGVDKQKVKEMRSNIFLIPGSQKVRHDSIAPRPHSLHSLIRRPHDAVK